MWLHLIVGTLVLSFVVEVSGSRLMSSMIVGSLCLGMVVYGVLTREYTLVINLGSYAVLMSRLLPHIPLDPLLLVAVLLVVMASGYTLMAREYRRYREAVCGDKGSTRIPAWFGVTLGITTLFLCIFALSLV